MSKCTHTPGPWVDGCTTQAVVEDGVLCYDVTEVHETSTDDATPIAYVLRDADARLITAAPDLLQACIDCRDAYQSMFDVMPVAWQTFDHILEAAINKAVPPENTPASESIARAKTIAAAVELRNSVGELSTAIGLICSHYGITHDELVDDLPEVIEICERSDALINRLANGQVA